MTRIPITDEELAEYGECGSAMAAEIVNDLMNPPETIPAPAVLPRTLTWLSSQDGLLIVTDKAHILVPAERADDFAPMLRALIHPAFSAEAGNC
jgi:hypothetical protein